MDVLIVCAVITAVGGIVAAWVSRATKELRPNGGWSMKDQVTRIDSTLDAHGNRINKLEVSNGELRTYTRIDK
jgi:hypothetical protein